MKRKLYTKLHKINILTLEDEPNTLEVTTEYMKMQGYEVTHKTSKMIP